MTNERLSRVLRNLDLSDCEFLRDNIYYTKRIVGQKTHNLSTGKDNISYSEYEFLVVAEDGVKKAIILNCGNIDLHWYVLRPWRKQHVLSNALRTGIIKEVWPEIESVTCCYEWGDDRESKLKLTIHLASLSGLTVINDTSAWIG